MHTYNSYNSEKKRQWQRFSFKVTIMLRNKSDDKKTRDFLPWCDALQGRPHVTRWPSVLLPKNPQIFVTVHGEGYMFAGD